MIDIAFDCSSDANGGDPDSKSPTLKAYHKLLWSKPLPSGIIFSLQDDVQGAYLHYKSASYEVALSSDNIGHSYRDVKKMQQVIEKVPPSDVESFWRLNCTIGAFIIFPGKKIEGSMTINQMRGVSPQIADRFDLTLECIRRFYSGLDSPMKETLDRYSEFFRLFESFQGYVDFFLLNDLLDSTSMNIHFFTSIKEPFLAPPLPQDVDEYLLYRKNSMDFIAQRNQRIAQWASAR
jgi:hypothetical protein